MQDVVIVGGGPGGSTLGCYLARAGVNVTLLEGAYHPRPHVGESLVTSTTRIFKEIEFLDQMEHSGFVRKYGAAWHPPDNKGEFDIQFREFPQPGVDQDYTWHVDRARFDEMLLQHAEAAGCKVHQGTKAKRILFEGQRATGVAFDVDGETVELRAKFVVDASGRATLLGNQLKLKQPDPIFNQYAVHAWFEGVDKGTGESAEYIHIYFLPVERGWVWQIPITHDVTSIGVVAERNVFRKSRKDPDAWFQSHRRSTPDLDRAMQTARRVNEFKSEGDYSYCMKNFVGDGWLMIGDAARFVDPIFSSGVSVALSSAKFASERILLGLEQDDTSTAMLLPYEEKLRRGVGVWYEFIRLYYKLLPLFTRFIQSPEHRHEVLQLLQGEVYDRQEVPVLDAMRKFIRTVESTEGHLLRHSLSDIPIE